MKQVANSEWQIANSGKRPIPLSIRYSLLAIRFYSPNKRSERCVF